MNFRYLLSFATTLFISLGYLCAQRNTATLGVGTVYYLGDMQQTTSDMRPAVTFQYQYQLLRNLSARVSFLRGAYGADDRNVEANQGRRLIFNSPIAEGTLQAVWDFLPQTSVNGIDWNSKHLFSPYICAGVGAMSFDPRVETTDGRWISLQPLGTEGQFIMRGNTYPKPYRLVQFVVPAGVGFHYRFARNMSLGVDIGYRHTFTDYLDDVSGYYPVKEDLAAFSGPNAVLLSDPAKSHAAGELRGNPNNKDSYITATVNLRYYFMKPVCPQPR